MKELVYLSPDGELEIWRLGTFYSFSGVPMDIWHRENIPLGMSSFGFNTPESYGRELLGEL